MKLGIVGFPGLYAGACTELDHQMTLWHKMGIDIHIVPDGDVKNEPLLNKTLFRATIHKPGNYACFKGMPVIAFCNSVFLRDLEKIKKYASKTMFVNCMTWLFEKEKNAHKDGLIDLFLYQADHTQKKVGPNLEKINKKYNWKTFKPWFDFSRFPFHKDRPVDKFRFGRISREDGDKYASESLWIYDTMVAPVLKSGIILGFNKKSKDKIGDPPDWIRTYPGNGITQQEFYAHCSCIIQKADTYENWPRVAFEAMASGSVLIVDNRGGWAEIIDHGKTGWLCDDARAFAYYSSRMAYETKERETIAQNAYDWLQTYMSEKECIKSWEDVFDG